MELRALGREAGLGLRLAGSIEKMLRVRFYLDALRPLVASAADHDYYNVFVKSRQDIEKLIPCMLKDARMLVMGCGYRYPDVLFYADCAADVRGLDVCGTFYRDGFLRLYRSYRTQGKPRLVSLYKAYSERTGLRRYYRRLRRLSGRNLRHKGLCLISYDGSHAPLGDNTCDVVMSNAVLQHVANLATFFSECARVTKPGGLSYHVLHNYCSFSGSLFSEWYCERYPWGHLRGVYQTNPEHLNRMRIGAVRELFCRWFEVTDVIPLSKDRAKKGIDPTFSYEREDLLTDEICAELAAYSREELLTRSYLLIGTGR